MQRQRVRMLDGYRVLYEPNHPNSMTSNNWKGYVYEHILIAGERLGRTIDTSYEVVHHLDGNRMNNRYGNLLVLSRSQHMQLHRWLDNGAPYEKSDGKQGMNSGKSKVFPICEVCQRTLQDKQEHYCSEACFNTAKSSHLPSKEELIILLENNSREAIGRMYNVSGNAVKKWAKKYGIL